MSTTVIFAELLIIGMQASVWAILLFIAIFGDGWTKPTLKFLELNSIASGVVFLGFAYTLGILVDATILFLSRIVRPKDLMLRFSWVRKQLQRTDRDRRMVVISREQQSAQFLAYMRSRVRILRGTSFNLIIFAASWIVVVSGRGSIVGYSPIIQTSVVVVILALVISLYCFMLAGIVDAAHDIRQAQIIEYENKESEG